MSVNIVARIRTLSNIAITLVIAALLFALWLGDGRLWDKWVWILGGVAVAGIVAQCLASLIFRNQIAAAWDEQARHLNRQSYAFGYWLVMATFLTFFALTQLDIMRPDTAFFFMSPALIGPSAYMAVAALRGLTD